MLVARPVWLTVAPSSHHGKTSVHTTVPGGDSPHGAVPLPALVWLVRRQPCWVIGPPLTTPVCVQPAFRPHSCEAHRCCDCRYPRLGCWASLWGSLRSGLRLAHWSRPRVFCDRRHQFGALRGVPNRFQDWPRVVSDRYALSCVVSSVVAPSFWGFAYAARRPGHIFYVRAFETKLLSKDAWPFYIFGAVMLYVLGVYSTAVLRERWRPALLWFAW